jgi:hypothetical protein
MSILLKDAIEKYKDRTLYIGAQSGWFYIGDSDCESELKEIAEDFHKQIQQFYESSRRKYTNAISERKVSKELLDIKKQTYQAALANYDYVEEHPDFLEREVLSDTERIPDDEGTGRLLKIEGPEIARFWFKSEYERDKKYGESV